MAPRSGAMHKFSGARLSATVIRIDSPKMAEPVGINAPDAALPAKPVVPPETGAAPRKLDKID
jgi:hypothetical protein